MPFILDTDLLTIQERKSQPAYDRLQARVQAIPASEIWVTVISLQERMQGWLAYVNNARTPEDLLYGYRRLLESLHRFCEAQVLPFDQAAQDRFVELRAQRLNVGTQDLRLASIALVHGATLLSRNLRDFRRVPNLVVEDWTQ